MKKISLKTLFLPMLCIALWACSSADDKHSAELKKMAGQEIVADPNPEAVKSKIDVYNSMARAVKYNINVTTQHLRDKIVYNDQRLQARDLIRSVLNVKAGNESQMYDAMRVLDYAIVFSADKLCEEGCNRDDYILSKTSQHLSLAAIKAHEDALFGLKKVKEIDRQIKKEQKVLDMLADKMSRTGKLSEKEIEYKKGLEVSVLEYNKIRNTLLSGIAQYAQLAKLSEKELMLEGRRFYELEDFDRKFTLDTFQEVAANNRMELSSARRLGVNSDYRAIKANVTKNYPDVERLALNGYDVKDPIYVDSLVKRSEKISEDLLTETLAYVNESNATKKHLLKDNAYAVLGEAIFIQVEMAYNLVNLSSLDLQAVEEKISIKKKDIREKEKDSRNSFNDNLEVINRKLKLLELEMQESQMLAERAVALRSLYFYAGFSPFNKMLLNEDIKTITSNLKMAFNQDLVEMLSNSPDQGGKERALEKDWAKGDDWLEKLVEKKAEPKISEIKEAPTPAVEAVKEVKGNVMQLGAYLRKESADIEWSMLKELYPELANYSPKLERATVNGQRYYRLVVEEPKQNFADLCKRIKSGNFDCLLR